MEIKEVENLLSISRSNIRFYEKEGLIHPERSGNNYRSYSSSDIAMLKKIIVLRKLGFSVEEISAMQKGDLALSDAMEGNIARLKAEINRLNGALETAKELSSEHPEFTDFNEEYYWNAITQAENEGKEFADICKDYLIFELSVFDSMWKYVFFHDFKKSRQKYGIPIACGILLLICLIRGISKVLIWQESFWSGFLYPILIFLAASAIHFPIYVLGKKAPKAAAVTSTILVVLAVVVLAVVVLAACGLSILYGVITRVIALFF